MKWAQAGVVVVVCLLASALLERLSSVYVQQIVVFCLINVILATSLNLVSGFAGQFSLGHAGFMAIGAYASASLSQNVTVFSGHLAFLNFPVYTLAAGFLAGLFGWLVGLPSLRLKGDYLAIVTLGFGEIIRVVILNMDSIGGARGLYGIPTIPETSVFGIVLSSFYLTFCFTLLWCLGVFLILKRMIASAFGRDFLSVREDELAASSLGIDTTAVKVRAFVVSSICAGIAGSLFAHFAGFLNPTLFQFVKSIDVVIMVVLGGMGSLTGSVLGAIIVTILPEALRPVQNLTGVDLRMVIYAVILIGLMVLRPKGILGSRELTWPKRAAR